MTVKTMKIALVAHDGRKKDLVDWVRRHESRLNQHILFCTGTTGKILKKEVGDHLDVRPVRSGPLGGDQEIGVKIADGEIDFLMFMVDGLSVQPHDSDVKALQRLAVIYNVPMATNRATAEMCISSPLFGAADFKPTPNDFAGYLNRKID